LPSSRAFPPHVLRPCPHSHRSTKSLHWTSLALNLSFFHGRIVNSDFVPVLGVSAFGQQHV
jgi:hypothetical protein